MIKKSFSEEESKKVSSQLGIKFDKFNLEQFRKGMNVELEHGTQNAKTNVTNDDAILTGKIAWAHLNEIPDYYFRLEQMEKEAKADWEKKK